jgi:hypothetical protein
MFVDGQNQRFYVATAAGTVLVLSAASLRQVGSIAVDSTPCYNEGGPFLTDEILADPAHGDLYLVGFSYCLGIINTTTNEALPTLSVGGDGPGFGTYNPVTDSIWLCYPEIPYPSPGKIVVLQHASFALLTSLLWLPPALGTILLSALTGIADDAPWARTVGEPAPSHPRVPESAGTSVSTSGLRPARNGPLRPAMLEIPST